MAKIYREPLASARVGVRGGVQKKSLLLRLIDSLLQGASFETGTRSWRFGPGREKLGMLLTWVKAMHSAQSFSVLFNATGQVRPDFPGVEGSQRPQLPRPGNTLPNLVRTTDMVKPQSVGDTQNSPVGSGWHEGSLPVLRRQR